MIAEFTPCTLAGTINAPPSKSMAHRYLIAAAISQETCTFSGVDFSEDILASMDCLKALGADTRIEKDTVTIHPGHFMAVENPILPCRESGSTLRFFIPLALCLGKPVVFKGSPRLFARPLVVYEDLCLKQGFTFTKDDNSLTVCGSLKNGAYELRGDISSQFITGMLFALACLGKASTVHILPPFQSKPYVDLSIEALQSFGADIAFTDEYTIQVTPSRLHAYSGRIEGDYSNAAFLDAFNETGSSIQVENLNPDSLQGDKVYKAYFQKIIAGTPTLDLSDCPDLGPVLIALAAMKNGAVFTGTDRLKAKESDRGKAMQEELQKLGGNLVFGDNTITVPKQELRYHGTPLDGHNDHRIVMAMSLVLSQTGGIIHGAEAVRKSYPGFFEDIQHLGAKVKTV